MTHGTQFGFSPAEWITAKAEIREILIETAARRSVITYGDLVKRVHTVHLEPDSYGLAHLLGEISDAEDTVGRGMLSVVVIRRDEPLPGGGFFHLAESRGRDISDRVACWTQEITTVHAAWANLVRN